jgi:hypothetical protein
MSIGAMTVVVCALLTVGVFGIYALRRRLRSGGPTGIDVAASQRRYLAANWSDVEAAALRSGMSPDEVAVVRQNLLGG